MWPVGPSSDPRLLDQQEAGSISRVPPCGCFSALCQSTRDLNAPPLPGAGPVSGAVGQGLPMPKWLDACRVGQS